MSMAVLTLMASSCSKDDKTRKEILTSKSWKLTVYRVAGTDQPIPDCVKDNYYEFNSNGTYQYFKGINLCVAGETTETGSWSMSADEKTFTLDAENYTIEEMSETIAIISQLDGLGIKTELTYKPL